MLKKTISYVDYEGNSRKEDFYFNINKFELIKWITRPGGYTVDQLLLKLTKEQNATEILRIFEDLVKISYGEKSLDGRQFVKNEELYNRFKQTEAYSELLTGLIMDAGEAAKFVNGIIPKELSEDVAKTLNEHPDGVPDEVKDYIVPFMTGG